MNANEHDIESTTPRKKLKQARLPFKIISDSTSVKDSPPHKKRKLSRDHNENESKIHKSNEARDNISSELVVISDDESKDSGEHAQENNCQVNPFVKMVDNVLKKKQKSKVTKQKKGVKQKTSKANDSCSIDDQQGNKEQVKMINENVSKNICKADKKLDKTLDNTSVSIKNISNSEQILNTVVIDEDSKEQENSMANCVSNADILETDTKNFTFNKEHNSPVDIKKHEQTTKPEGNVELQNKESDFDSNNSTIKSNAVILDKNISNVEKQDTNPAMDVIDLDFNEAPEDLCASQKNKLEKSNSKDKMDTSSVSSKLDDSTSSDLSTPRKSKRNSVNNKNNLNESSGPLTPRQLHRKEEIAKKKSEREQEKQEREKKKRIEKEEKQRVKKEKEELKKREREEKEELKRKEKEEKERQKELERKLKEEKEEKKRKEKEEKEEQKRKEKEAKDEEKRKKQEAVELERQEQEMKKKKAAEAFAKFLVLKQKAEKDEGNASLSKNSMLSSFTKKADMRLAPLVRAQLDADQRKELDTDIEVQSCGEKKLYLYSLKEGLLKPKSSGKTWPRDDKNDEQDDDDDVMIIEDELPLPDGADEEIELEPIIREKLRPKLLSFHENRRPPYWGTWRKKSAHIKPRRPFGEDKKQLDYEVDSDEEWEEEEGESIDGSVAGSDDEPNEADEYEVDNELFVPHGYLSDEEATMDEDDVLSLSPETQKARLKHLEDEFESEMKKPTEKLKTRLYGLIWENTEGGKPESCIDSLWNYFSKMAMIVNDPTPFLQPSNDSEEIEKRKIKKKKSQVEGEPTTTPKHKKKNAKSVESKEISKTEIKSVQSELKKNQPGINAFLKKLST